MELKPDSEKIIQSIIISSDSFKLPVEILLSWLYQESKFSPRAINYNDTSTDHGLTQQNSRYVSEHVYIFEKDMGKKLSKSEIYTYNVVLGSYILLTKIKKFNTIQLGLMAYNCGNTPVLRNKIPASTVDYAKSIMAKSRGWLFEKEVLPMFVVKMYRKKDGSSLTANEAYSKLQYAQQKLL